MAFNENECGVELEIVESEGDEYLEFDLSSEMTHLLSQCQLSKNLKNQHQSSEMFEDRRERDTFLITMDGVHT